MEKKCKVNKSTAREVLTKKHNGNHTLHRRKQTSQKTQTHQFENQNYQQISATIEKEKTSQQKFDLVSKVKYHRKKEKEMSSRLPSTFQNAIA